MFGAELLFTSLSWLCSSDTCFSTMCRSISGLQPMHDIFLSHSGHEKPFVVQLNKDLREKKHRPFFDQSPDSLPKAEEFETKIFQAAEQCRLGVVVVSEGYLTSK